MICGNLDFNRYTNLDSVEWRIIKQLLDSSSKHAENIWKSLAYPTSNCLLQDNLSRTDKINLIYTGDGLSTAKRVFMMPYVDDAWEEQAARLDIFVSGITPKNHVISTVNVTFEILVHNKINNIIGDADGESSLTNPTELDSNGDIIIPYKSRATLLLKSVLAEFNGTHVEGIGQLQHNITMNSSSQTLRKVWNNRAYFGYEITLSTLLSGVSESGDIGY